MRRRTVARVLATTPFLSQFPASTRGAGRFDPLYASATDALAAMNAGAISSRELVDHLYSRIRAANGPINAFVTLAEEQAVAAARKADETRARNRKSARPLEGLPITIKDAFATAGIRTTAGSKPLEKFVPQEDAVAVGKLRAAGAIVIGKTNLPEFSADLQSYNDVCGTTNNPWDRSRTPGGSTGGDAAAIASGFSYLELGSDSGGSIRIPAHFCGVYGHKSSVHLVSRTGWIPPMPGQLKGPNDISVSGPLARHAADLRLLLEIAAGKGGDDAVAWRAELPRARHTRLQDFRAGWILDDPYCPVDAEALKPLSQTLEAIRRSGVQLEQGWPQGFDLRKSYEALRFLTTSYFAGTIRAQDKELLKAELGGAHQEYAQATLAALDTTYVDWERVEIARLESRRLWQQFFRTHDVFLMPVTILPAIEHDHSMPRHRRVIRSSSGSRSYQELSPWIAPAGLAGLPSTVIPAGRTAAGLPVGLQIVGPYLEDRTTIELARLLEKAVGGFVRPPSPNSQETTTP